MCRSAARLGVIAAAGIFLLTLPVVHAEEPAAVPRKVFCPVVGLPECKCMRCPSGYCPQKPTPQLTLDYKGGKVQFCCGKCRELFKQTPGKFAANANHQLAATGQAVQHKCPLCGGACDPSHAVDIGGVKVFFCSKECCMKVTDATPANRVGLVFNNQAFDRAFAVNCGQK
jgi:YHS domain-containing protein